MPADLWQFSEAIYRRPGVEPACLELQSDGIDVCLLLCALWLEVQRVPYSAARLQHLQALAQPWQQQVVLPLRQLRRAWRTAAQQDQGLHLLREQLKQLELTAEREQLTRLATCAEPWIELRAQGPADWLTALAPHATDATLDCLRGAAQGLPV
ncbi:TIGR02444 family protein [Pseudomonas sp. 5P_3.1_Bac2]|uniref:TIGR02444 family protein n=1 Tax=Pseudomonas sp. 5P_3.1_Bac2 TaxID=2971617 RepID=UPI0021C9D56F|nr:TIGR02444 family protein [Pseudomonas sp. 5P_3.1_Bac2]MCU1717999.1 TIGR02444 family protein [Pseudomonas sp. 5P_3.1_Bac2]